MILVYVLPLVNIGGRRRPKYMETLGIGSWQLQDFGLVLLAVIRANVTPAQNASLIANSDVYGFGPEDRDTIPTPAELTQLVSVLESLKIPADLIVAGKTWRELIHIVLAMITLIQRMDFYGVHPYPAGITLSTKWSQMPVVLQDGLRQAAIDLNYSTALMQGQSTYRQIFVQIMQEFTGFIYLGGEAF